MNIQLIKNLCVLFFACSFLFSTIIKGVVSNKESGEPLIGANILIQETSQGSATDINGAYLIDNVKSCLDCVYTLKALYIGYEEYTTKIKVLNENDINLNLVLSPTSLEVETTKVIGKKRRDKITDAPAAIELVSAKDIKKEESTNLGAYLKGIKGVDFTSSGVNNYSISVRGFNSSFTSRLLTLTDGRIANIPALRVINYSTVPQSSKDIESIEIVLGPSSALYGANAHSGVVNIISKSPADSEGLDVSASGSIGDNRNLYKYSARWANKINEKLSFKLSTMYLQANEWEFIAENEYKAHKYPWSGNAGATVDGKDNNAYNEYLEPEGGGSFIQATQQSAFRNYLDINGDNVFDPVIDIEYNEMVQDPNECQSGQELVDGQWASYECDQIIKYIGNGDPNDTGDPDGDGFMGEDWFNGYDDDGDCPGDTNGDGIVCGPGDVGVDEDYFFADGIDNGGAEICDNVDTNGDGIICGPGDFGVDENIDSEQDKWIDGIDNNGNGQIDEPEERNSNTPSKFNLPDWQYDLDFNNIIINNGRANQYTKDTNWDGIIDENDQENVWFSQEDNHLRGAHYFDEEKVELIFDVFHHDYGPDGIPGDNSWHDIAGNAQFYAREGDNTIESQFTNIDGMSVPSEGCRSYSETFDMCTNDDWAQYIQNSSSNNAATYVQNTFDCGLDGICEEYWYFDSTSGVGGWITNPNWDSADLGEGNGVVDYFDWDYGYLSQTECNAIGGSVYYPNGLCGDGKYTDGDEWTYTAWVDTNNNDYPDQSEIDSNQNGIVDNDEIWTDNFPYANGIYNPAFEDLWDCGQDGVCENLPGPDGIYGNDDDINNPNWPGADFGDGDGITVYPDCLEYNAVGICLDGELDGAFDTGDGCFGCDAETLTVDNNNNGIYDDGDQFIDSNYGSISEAQCITIPGAVYDHDNATCGDGKWTPADFEDNFRTVYDTNGDGILDAPDFEVKNAKSEFRLDFDPNPDLNFTFQTGYSWSKLQQVTGTGRYLADGYRYTYYQLRSRYKNWFAQVYLNQGNSGETRGYDLGNVITDKSRNMAFQLQNNFDIKNTNIVWGIDFFRTEAKTDGSILNDGPNGYDNDGDAWYTGKDNLDNDGDSDDFNDWGIDGIGPYLTTSDGSLVIDTCDNCEEIVTESESASANVEYNSQYNFYYVDLDDNQSWDNDDNDCYPFICNSSWTGADYGEGDGIPTAQEQLNIDIGEAQWNQSGFWSFNNEHNYNSDGDFWYDGDYLTIDTGDAVYDNLTEQWIFNACYDPQHNYSMNGVPTTSEAWYDCNDINNILQISEGDAYYNEGTGNWEFNANYSSVTELWFDPAQVNTGDLTYSGSTWDYSGSNNWFNDIDGDGNFDPGEPGVNSEGIVYSDGIDNDCDACDFDGDGYLNFQEIQLNTNIYDPTDHPNLNPESILQYNLGVDELIDEEHCGNIQYIDYVPSNQLTGTRDGRQFTCEEGIDEQNEFIDVTSNEMGFYFQTKTIPKRNKKIEIITAARFDHHDQLNEGIQFAPKFGIFYKPNSVQTFRLTYGKAYNTPSALTLHTDLFIGKRGIIDYYLRGNVDGTPYTRVGDELITSIPQIQIEGQLYNMSNITAGGSSDYWNGYQERVQGAPYFLGFRTDFSDVPEFMPLDPAIYTVWVPELTGDGRIYTPEEAKNIADVDPIKTEKIQTLEIGFKGFISERVHLTADYYVSYYQDFFSAPTVITPLIIKRQFVTDNDGITTDITSFDNIDVVGILPINYNLSNPPYATQWDGRDNDQDWHYTGRHLYFDNVEDTYVNSDGTTSTYTSYDHPAQCENGCAGDWYHYFGWDGVEEVYEDQNNNNMYDYGEPFTDCDYNSNGTLVCDGDPNWEPDLGNDVWNCNGCGGEWGYVDWIEDAVGDTTGYTIYRAEDIVNIEAATQDGNIDFGSYQPVVQFWVPVGVDEYSSINGLSEAEMILSPRKDGNNEQITSAGFAYTPLHSILAPMNYGNIWMQGLDIGITYLIPDYKITLDGNFSFYKTTSYYNELTKKDDPINAPKFKMNASLGWQSPIGDMAIKYRHVDRFEWKDGLWAGWIGPYDLFDLHYNYKINRFLEFNLTTMNLFDNRHKEMIGGAVMRRQYIIRLTASI